MIEPPLHPLVRVVVLLVFITGIALAQPLLLFAACVCLLMAHMHAGFPESRLLFRMILRLRWLLLAILIVYGWWTPGEILFPRMGELSPTRQGLQFGVIRMLALICIVSAVHLLLQVTERGQLLTALMQLTRPVLSRGARERFAVRVLLTLEAVGQVQTMVGDVLKARAEARRGLPRMVFYLQTVYAAALRRADQSPRTPIEVLGSEAPPPLQWLAPVLLACTMWLISSL